MENNNINILPTLAELWDNQILWRKTCQVADLSDVYPDCTVIMPSRIIERVNQQCDNGYFYDVEKDQNLGTKFNRIILLRDGCFKLYNNTVIWRED